MSSPVVLFALANAIARLQLDVLIVRRKPDSQLRSEVLALRHQLRVLERQVSRTRWQPSDQLLLAAISPAQTGVALAPAQLGGCGVRKRVRLWVVPVDGGDA